MTKAEQPLTDLDALALETAVLDKAVFYLLDTDSVVNSMAAVIAAHLPFQNPNQFPIRLPTPEKKKFNAYVGEIRDLAAMRRERYRHYGDDSDDMPMLRLKGTQLTLEELSRRFVAASRAEGKETPPPASVIGMLMGVSERGVKLVDLLAAAVVITRQRGHTADNEAEEERQMEETMRLAGNVMAETGRDHPQRPYELRWMQHSRLSVVPVV